ncbi:MAG TPA: protein-L-isoaspartate(D-aspartate) O-methyltransferase [Candidatus Acidoferrum sp.]|nr:protein-L-isoaspartate(D-aspartate) O-methyltransferase [Candidatus Acidoferrum sp.]
MLKLAAMFRFNEGDQEAVYAVQRERMVAEQIERRGVTDPEVLAAMRTVPRHRFVPEEERQEAYFDGPLSIGSGQTISQPYVVASMTEALGLTHRSKALEIGTGSGYQTAVLAEIVDRVFSVEIRADLYERATQLLSELGYRNIRTMLGNGYSGWPQEAPFDGIIVTAAAPYIPPALLDQLAVGGRMIIPVQEEAPPRQELLLLEKTDAGITRRVMYEVRFVPLIDGQ